MTMRINDVHYDKKGKVIKCVDSYNQGLTASLPELSSMDFELISDAINYYTNSLNDGKGVPFINSYAGKLLTYLEDFTEINVK